MKKTYFKKTGFTLVELMVAIAVFSIVMVVATGALLNVIDANQKAQTIKTAINNINFALEGISKDMRMGTNYGCGQEVAENTSEADCLTGGKLISYKSPKEGGRYVYYRFKKTGEGENEVGRIERRVCLDNSPQDCSDYSPLTSSEINITSLSFYLVGASDSRKPLGNRTQPRVLITLTGEAGKKEKTQTQFSLQTSVSQRPRLFEEN